MANAKSVPIRCECGRRMSKDARCCLRCDQEKRAARYSEARRIVATGQCPLCGHALRRNLSLTGWWQCEQYGADTHRAIPDLPACSFQTFTE